MYRKSIEKLSKWKKSNNRKPLIIRGARQVGKTWLVKEFGKKNYRNTAYVNFEGNQRMQKLFSGDFDIQRILTGLELETDCKIKPGETLIVFDEVQESSSALTSLKYFQEEAPQHHVIAAGSLLGVALHQHASFPVGKVSFFDLGPLLFDEFLNALNKQKHLDLLQKQDWALVESFQDKYMEFLKQYMFVGGMPEAVASFAENNDYQKVREIQKNILRSYEQDFSKHVPTKDVPRIRLLYNSIPSQLAKENKKFIYKLIKKGARAREYELAMMWLKDCGLIHKINRISKPGFPASAYVDVSAFKLYILDVGLLGALSGIDPITLLEGNKIYQEFKGSLTEQYVLEQLWGNYQEQIFYWSNQPGSSEVDFIIQKDNNIIPIEVKAGENLKAKSLTVYRKKYNPDLSIRASASNYHQDGKLVNIPLYAIFMLPELLEKQFS